jgi:ABC-type sugar transport system substrate-binding protein
MKRRIARNRSRRSIAALAGVLFASALALSACTSGNSGSAANAIATTNASSSPHALVGFLASDATHNPFAVALAKGTLDEASKLGLNLSYVDAKGDLTAEIGAIQSFMSRGAKVIVVFPADPTSLVPILNQAAGQGIKIVVLNQPLEPSAKIVTYVGADNYAYGQAEGQLLAKALNGSGTFALAEGITATQAALDRTNGIENTLKAYPNIHMVALQTDNWDPTQALSLAQDWLSKYPTISAMVYEGPEGTVAGQWARAHGRANLKVILGDYPTAVEQAIQAGYVYGTVDQNPVQQGVLAMQVAQEILDGHESQVPQPVLKTPLPLITSANVADNQATW